MERGGIQGRPWVDGPDSVGASSGLHLLRRTAAYAPLSDLPNSCSLSPGGRGCLPAGQAGEGDNAIKPSAPLSQKRTPKMSGNQ